MQYYAKSNTWFDANTQMKLYFKIPFTNWGSWGGNRTCEFPLTEGVPFGKVYWSTYMCSFEDFYTKE